MASGRRERVACAEPRRRVIVGRAAVQAIRAGLADYGELTDRAEFRRVVRVPDVHLLERLDIVALRADLLPTPSLNDVPSTVQFV